MIRDIELIKAEIEVLSLKKEDKIVISFKNGIENLTDEELEYYGRKFREYFPENKIFFLDGDVEIKVVTEGGIHDNKNKKNEKSGYKA